MLVRGGSKVRTQREPRTCCASTRLPHLRFFRWYKAASVGCSGWKPHCGPCPATPRMSPAGLSGSGLLTQPRTPRAERVTGAPSTPHTPSARAAGSVARPCSDHGDGRAAEGTPATRTPEEPGKRGGWILSAGLGLVEASQSRTGRGVRRRPCQRRSCPVYKRGWTSRNTASSSG